MAKTKEELIKHALKVQRATGFEENTAEDVGTLFFDIIDAFPQNEIKTIAFSDLDGMTNPFADTGIYNITFNGTDSIGTLWSMKPWGNRNLFQVVLTPSSADDLNSRGTGVPTQHYGEMFLCMRHNTSDNPSVWGKWEDMITKGNEIKTTRFDQIDGLTNPFTDTGTYNIVFNEIDSIGTLWAMKPWGNNNILQVILSPSNAGDLNNRGTGVPTQHYGEMFICMRYNTSSTPGVWSKWKDMITKDNEIKTTRFDEIDGLTNPFTDTGAYNIVHNEIDSIGTLWAMKPWGNRNILQVILSPSDAEGLNSRGDGLPAQWYNQMFLCMRYNTANNPDVWSDWQNMSSQTTVIDNLNSTSTTSALSAAQGKALDEKKADRTELNEYAYAPNIPEALIDPNTLETKQVDDAGNIAIYWKQKDLAGNEKENALNLPVATTSLNGIMSATDKSKLDGMSAKITELEAKIEELKKAITAK